METTQIQSIQSFKIQGFTKKKKTLLAKFKPRFLDNLIQGQTRSSNETIPKYKIKSTKSIK